MQNMFEDQTDRKERNGNRKYPFGRLLVVVVVVSTRAATFMVMIVIMVLVFTTALSMAVMVMMFVFLMLMRAAGACLALLCHIPQTFLNIYVHLFIS